MIVETDYPGCILDRDKVRLYSQSANSLTRPQYLGDQRVIQVRNKNIGLKRLKTLKQETHIISPYKYSFHMKQNNILFL